MQYGATITLYSPLAPPNATSHSTPLAAVSHTTLFKRPETMVDVYLKAGWQQQWLLSKLDMQNKTQTLLPWAMNDELGK